MSLQPRGGSASRAGFTLIELMIVVVIIGILAAIAIPRFSLASWEAKEKEADTILKQVYQAHQAYLVRHATPATSATQLSEVGFEAPTRLEYYQIPADAAYGLPLCLTSKGTWENRQVDSRGVLSDC